MKKNILIFASKRVGWELVSYLLENNAPVQKIICGTSEDQRLLTLAKKYNIPAVIYSKQVQSELLAEEHRYTWLLNLWCPHILKTSVLELATHRLNIHPSLAPHCQGNDNAAWTIRKGLPAGVSLLEMAKNVDEGKVYAQKETSYTFPMTGKELLEISQDESIKLFKESWPGIYEGTIVPQPQVGPVSKHTRKQTEEDRVREAKECLSLEEYLSWILGHDFYPGTTAELRYQEKTYKLRLLVEEKTT